MTDATHVFDLAPGERVVAMTAFRNTIVLATDRGAYYLDEETRTFKPIPISQEPANG